MKEKGDHETRTKRKSPLVAVSCTTATNLLRIHLALKLKILQHLRLRHQRLSDLSHCCDAPANGSNGFSPDTMKLCFRLDRLLLQRPYPGLRLLQLIGELVLITPGVTHQGRLVG